MLIFCSIYIHIYETEREKNVIWCLGVNEMALCLVRIRLRQNSANKNSNRLIRLRITVVFQYLNFLHSWVKISHCFFWLKIYCLQQSVLVRFLSQTIPVQDFAEALVMPMPRTHLVWSSGVSWGQEYIILELFNFKTIKIPCCEDELGEQLVSSRSSRMWVEGQEAVLQNALDREMVFIKSV